MSQKKCAIITGGSKGVGLAIAKRMVAQGIEVMLVARNASDLKYAKEELGALCSTLSADLQSVSECKRVIEETLVQRGRIDILVNNAGAHFRGEIAGRSADEIATMIDVNLRAPLVLSRLALDSLTENRGHIINVASIAGKIPLPDAATYSASKFGLRAFSIAMAQEVEASGVKVSLVSPGPIIDTGFLMNNMKDAADVVFAQPMSTSDDVAQAAMLCLKDGKRERAWPRSSSRLATLGYLMPSFRKRLLPLMNRKGRRIKEKYMKEGS